MTLNPDYDTLVDNLRAKGITYSEIFSMLQPKDTNSIPLEILKNRKLGMLESVTVFLKDKKKLTYSQIAKLLNRDDRTIWSSYSKAKNKLNKRGLRK
jgi:hypothetical protein